jgi:Glycosyltransferase family 87
MSSRPGSPLRSILLAAVLLAAIAFIGWKVRHLLADPTFFPPDDFVEYYAAGRLNALGQNPYDGNLLLDLEQRAGRDTAEPVMMWNPPWTLTLVMPLGLFDASEARVAQLLWLAVSLVLVVGCADRLWIDYGGPVSRRWVSWILALSFLPTVFVLQAGQIGPFILLGITGFLVAERRGRLWLAGACGVLMAIKPHLVYLFWIALAAWVIRRPLPDRWKVIAGGVFAGLMATAIPLACNPDVLGQYWDAMTHRTPEQWKSPTLGSLLRELFGEERFSLQFVPTVIGLAWLAVHGWMQRERSWNWSDQMPMVILVSFATASYGAWPFDLVILLPAVIQVAAGLSRLAGARRIVLAIALFAAINGTALAMNLAHVSSDRFVWMAPTLLAAYVLLRPRSAAS